MQSETHSGAVRRHRLEKPPAATPPMRQRAERLEHRAAGPRPDLDRVVIVSDQSAPVGGAEAIALMSANAMADAGIPVTFIAGDNGEQCPLDRSRIDVVVLSGAPLADGSIASGIDGLYNRSAKASVQAFIAAHDTPRTVYHLHNWTKILSPAVFRALKPVHSRLFISAHDFSLVCPTLSYSNYQKGGEACRLKPLSAACVASHCDRRSYMHKLWRVARSVERQFLLDLAVTPASVGIIHPDMAEYFTRGGIPAERLRVIRNPVTPFAARRIEAERNSDLFFIGRVVQEKGVDLAAEAARLAGRRLRVIGDGDIKTSLMQRYPEVVFEGWKTHAQISELMKDARALLVPSRLPETFTLVAHEAMRAGIPVIAFSDVDCREAAELGAAIAVPPRDVSSLVNGIRLIDDDDDAQRMSKIAFAEAHRFSNTVDTWREAMLGHYCELVRREAARTTW